MTTGSTDGRYFFYATPGRYLIQVLDPGTAERLYSLAAYPAKSCSQGK